MDVNNNKYIMWIFRLFVVTVSFFSVYFSFFSQITGLSFFRYLDEVVFLVILIVLFSYYIKTVKVHISHFILLSFILYSIAVSMLFGFNDSLLNVIGQTLINLKFFILLFGFILLFKRKFKFIDSYVKIVFGFALFGLLLHITLGINYNQIFDIPTYARPNIRYVGFLPHPNHMAYIAVLYIGYLLSKVEANQMKFKVSTIIQILISIVILFLADSRTSIVAVLILFVGFYWHLLKKNALILVYVFSSFLVIILLLIVFTDIFTSIIQNISASFTLESSYIRGNMIFLSGMIFYEFFPIGTGAASFGSVLANNKVYEYYGQADRYYFSNDIGLYDSNIASVVGEYGLVGIVFYYLLFRFTYKYLKKSFNTRGDMLKYVFFVFIFYTITNPMITNNVYILISIPLLMKIAISSSEINKYI